MADEHKVDGATDTTSSSASPLSRLSTMKTRSRSSSGSPRELVKLRAWKLDTVGGTSPAITGHTYASSPLQGFGDLFSSQNWSKLALTLSPVLIESPKIPLSSVETHLNMGSFSPIQDPTSPDTPTNTNGVRKVSYPIQARAGRMRERTV